MIPKEKQQSIFEFLEQGAAHTQDGSKSWGMGLTLVKMVAEAHGGAVRLESNEKDGTRFIVMLNKHSNKPGKKKMRLRGTII